MTRCERHWREERQREGAKAESCEEDIGTMQGDAQLTLPHPHVDQYHPFPGSRLSRRHNNLGIEYSSSPSPCRLSQWPAWPLSLYHVRAHV